MKVQSLLRHARGLYPTNRMPWSCQARDIQSCVVPRQGSTCALMSLTNPSPRSGVKTGVGAMGEEYREEASGDARRGVRKYPAL